MDKINKELNKLDFKERQELRKILLKINNKNFQNLDIKKLKGRIDIFRIRKNNMRIIFHKTNSSVNILSIERRTSKTYKKR